MTRCAGRARQPLDGRPQSLSRLLWVAALLPAAAMAQGTASGPGLRFGASIDGQASYVVNSRLGGRDAGEFVAEVRPGFSVSSRAGRILGSLSYGLSLSQRSRNSESDDDVRHNLAAQFSAEAVERWMYIDGTANISQQLRDPYGSRSAGDSAAGANNRLEVLTASVSPYVRGQIAGATAYELRLNAGATNARRSIVNDSTSWGGALNVTSRVGLLGWGLQASSQETDYRASRNTRNDRVTLSANWIPDPDLTLVVRGGEESSDVGSLEQERTTNWGGGLTWRPSPRTRAQFDYDKRYFGDAYSVAVEHRLSQTTFSLTSSRADSGTSYGSQPAVTALQLREAILAASISDPVLRQQQALSDLQLAGIDPAAILIPAQLNSAVSVIQNHGFTIGYTGRRISLGLQAYLSKSSVIDTVSLISSEPVEQHGWTFSASYRLNPTTSVFLSGGRQDTRATATRAGTNLKSVAANLGTQLGRGATANVGARYSVFNSSTEPYREAAVTASLGYRF